MTKRTVVTALWCLTFPLLALAVTACPGNGSTRKKQDRFLASVKLGNEFWHVETDEGVHGFAPQYIIKIDRSWNWPRSSVGKLSFVAQARCGDADPISLGDWPLVEGERFTVFQPITSEQHAKFVSTRNELRLEIEKAERALAEQAPDPNLPRQELIELLKQYDALPQPPYEALRALEASHAAAMSCTFRLRAMLEDRQGPATDEEAPTRTRHTWGVPEADGKTPEEKAREKLDAFIRRICEHRAPNGSAAPYEEECRHLRERLRTGKLAIPCSIEGRYGYVRFRDLPDERNRWGSGAPPPLNWDTLEAPAGGVPIAGVLFLNGDHLIDSDCALATVLHEAAHSADETVAREQRVAAECRERRERADAELAAARAAYQAARDAHEQNPTPATEEAWLSAARTRREVSQRRDAVWNECQALEPTTEQRERQKLEHECHAYRTEREALDSGLFGSLENADVMRWAKSDFVNELDALAHHADENPGGKSVACDCMNKAVDWLKNGQHDSLRRNLRSKKALHRAIGWHLRNCRGFPYLQY